MKPKQLMRIVSAALCLAMLISALCIPVYAQTSDSAGSCAFTQEDMLKTDGRKIVNQRGEEILLKGVNLGSWLIHEAWMTPIEGTEDNISTFEVLTERFGVDGAYELINTYEDNWITEYDLDRIKEMGFNCVRVPFWFRNFYYDDKGTKIYDENGDWDFSRLDWVVEECGKRGIYVILDLHGAPGYQSNKDHCGKVNSCGLFKLTEEAEAYRKLTIELWTAIAQRFNGNPTVAMYDLLNEPMCDVKSYLIKNNISTIALYDRLYDAVREVDSEHIMTMEGIWRLYNLPAPWLIGWKNVVYQLHLYDKTDLSFRFNIATSKLYPYNVPIYIGEFKPLEKATWECVLGLFNDSNYSWTIWSYKGCGHGAWSSDWFIYGSKNGFERANVNTDSFDEIKRKWGECIRTENGYTDTGFYDTISPFI